MKEAPPEELDLTKEPEDAGGAARPLERDYDPAPERERVRGQIALGLTAAVVVVSALVVVLLAWGKLQGGDLEKLQLFFTPLVALAGTALGFYFGGRDVR